MINLPKKIFYAIEAVLYIAYNGSALPISSKEIADKQGLPPRYLEQIMQRLVRAGILRGVRGPRGGYLLARDRRRVTIADICTMLNNGDDEEDEMLVHATPLGQRIIRPLWDKLEQQVLSELEKVNMAELCEQAQSGQIRKTSGEKADFTI